jgi:septal ring factor EnvC (AmiA/AmiB activator)
MAEVEFSNTMKRYLFLTIALVFWGSWGNGLAADSLKKAIDVEVSGQKAATASQKKIEQLDDESRKMLEEYRQLTQQLERVTLANEDMQSKLDRQAGEIERINQELEEIDRMRSEIDPLMSQMLDTLGQLVERDTPFLAQERQARVKALEAAYENRTGEISERFRQLLEAYQIEADYGRNIEAYQAQLDQLNGTQKMVDFLRLGRVALFYQTLDGKAGGVWDNQKRSWVRLDAKYMAELTRAIRIARKQLPPDLMVLPLVIAEEGKQ